MKYLLKPLELYRAHLERTIETGQMIVDNSFGYLSVSVSSFIKDQISQAKKELEHLEADAAHDTLMSEEELAKWKAESGYSIDPLTSSERYKINKQKTDGCWVSGADPRTRNLDIIDPMTKQFDQLNKLQAENALLKKDNERLADEVRCCMIYGFVRQFDPIAGEYKFRPMSECPKDMPEWHPIETLPRDGNPVLVWAAGCQVQLYYAHEVSEQMLMDYSHWAHVPPVPQIPS